MTLLLLLVSVALLVICLWFLENNGIRNTLANKWYDITAQGGEWDTMMVEDADKMSIKTTFCFLQHLLDVNDTKLKSLFVTCFIFCIQSACVTRKLLKSISKSITFSGIHEVCGKKFIRFCPENNIFKRSAIHVYISSFESYVKEKMKGSPQKILMKYEWARWLSFNTFPKDCVMSSMRLAQAGFYYTGTSKEVKCFCCGITNSDWSTVETALEVHKRLSPSCAFIRGEGTENIPIHDEDTIRYPNYASLESRRMSSDGHSFPSFLNTDVLASAGFFYTGKEDIFCCFHCGTCLCDWEREDDPWFEHARHKPSCKYVLFQKGEEFVRLFDSVKRSPAPDLPFSVWRPDVNTFTTKETQCKILQAELKTKERENMKLKQLHKCKVCLDNDVAITFLPCGHFATCHTCAPSLRTCCICRQVIRGTVRTYFS